MSTPEIITRKVKAYNLLRNINGAMGQAKQWQAELQQLESEINELEQAEKEDGLS